MEKANAGDIKSQYYLASHYYEIGDYENSTYWYKLACSKPSEYQASALNNLSYIYLNHLKDSYIENENYSMVLNLLKRASELNHKIATQNLYILLKSNTASFFEKHDYETEVVFATEKMNTLKLMTLELEEYGTNWRYVGRFSYDSTQTSTDTTKYKYISSKDKLGDNYRVEKTIMYDVYELECNLDKQSKVQYVYEQLELF